MGPARGTVIIVDDEPDTADMLAEMTRLSGFQVKKSYGGKQAMALIAAEKPRVVILDIMMPDASGLDVVHFMRRDPVLAHIPVIIVSAKCLPSDIKTGLDAGANLYLAKPVAFHELVNAINGTVGEGSRNL